MTAEGLEKELYKKILYRAVVVEEMRREKRRTRVKGWCAVEVGCQLRAVKHAQIPIGIDTSRPFTLPQTRCQTATTHNLSVTSVTSRVPYYVRAAIRSSYAAQPSFR